MHFLMCSSVTDFQVYNFKGLVAACELAAHPSFLLTLK